MDNLYWLEQIQPSDLADVGHQALHLSRVMQLGYPVLPGFVVSAQVWRKFLADLRATTSVGDLLDSCRYLNVDDDRQLQQSAQALRQEVHNASVPDWLNAVALATANWETPLLLRLCLVSPTQAHEAVSGLWEAQVSANTPGAIATALLQTWGQLFRARSLLYWQRTGVDLAQIDLAILVQPLHNAIAAGTLNLQAATVEIQASFGLGIAIARGEVLPDTYIVELESGAVRSQSLGHKTIAYTLAGAPRAGLTPSPTRFTEPEDYSQSLIDFEQQQEYALTENDLQQLIAIAQQLAQDLNLAFVVEWMFSTENESPELYISQISATRVALPSIPLPPTAQFPLRGLAAAPGRFVAPVYVVTDDQQKPMVPPGVILVTTAIAPDWLPLLQQVTGFITEQGGLTSHSAILARELGIPAVVSVARATQLLHTNDLVDLNGDRGEIQQVNSPGDRSLELGATTAFYTPHISNSVPIATQLLVNLSQPNLLAQASSLPVDGIGLVRSELMLLSLFAQQDLFESMQQRQHELIVRWREQIIEFARAFAPRPIFYRSLDWRSPESQLLAKTANFTAMQSGFGQSRIVSYLQNPALFDLELTVLAEVQQSGCDNVRLLLPFIRTVEEFSFCRRRVEQAGLTQHPQFQLWIMAEVPSVLFLISEYVQAGVQGVSIGTNDLTQLLLGVDRDLGTLATMFDARHPVVLRAIAQIIHDAKQANIPCSICGQAPVLYPELIDSLIRWGITAISVEVDAVERTYHAIARAEQRLLLAAAQNSSPHSILASDLPEELA